MEHYFSNNPDDIQRLKDTALRGVELGRYSDFSSYMLYGNDDSPDRVCLYNTANPDHDESHARVSFVYDMVYCTIDYC